MPIQYDTEAEQLEHQHELEKYDLLARQKALERQHIENLAKLKIELAGKNRRGVTKIEAVTRVFIALVKLPTMPLVLCTIALLLLLKREVPAFIQAYISL